MQPAVQKDAASVVKIEGQGCGGIVEGSGFVVANDMIVTNAHVVAGIQTPYVLDSPGTHRATAIWFDPNLDLAVLKVSDLAGKPLSIQTKVAAVVLAARCWAIRVVAPLPPNRPLSWMVSMPRAVISTIRARSNREIYEVKADIIPGNSGGPLIAKDGTV